MGRNILILFNILKTDKHGNIFNIKRKNKSHCEYLPKTIEVSALKVYRISTKLSIAVNNNALCKYEVTAHFGKCIISQKSLLNFKLFMIRNVHEKLILKNT